MLWTTTHRSQIIMYIINLIFGKLFQKLDTNFCHCFVVIVFKFSKLGHAGIGCQEKNILPGPKSSQVYFAYLFSRIYEFLLTSNKSGTILKNSELQLVYNPICHTSAGLYLK